MNMKGREQSEHTCSLISAFVVCCLYSGIGEFRPQMDQRSDIYNLQHVKGETGRNRYKAVT